MWRSRSFIPISWAAEAGAASSCITAWVVIAAFRSRRNRSNNQECVPSMSLRIFFLALESSCAKIGGIHKIGQMLFRSTALWGGGFAYLIDKTARRMHLPSYP